MGYTWTDGELITATKLNNTGGGGGYDFTINADWDDNGNLYDNPLLDSGTYSDLVSAIQNGTIVNGLLLGSYSGRSFLNRLDNYLYLSQDNQISVGFVGLSPTTNAIESYYFIIESDGTVFAD